MQNYNQGHQHHLNNNGFSNPFEPAVHPNQMPNG